MVSAHEHFLSYRQMGEVIDWYVDWMDSRGLEAEVAFLSERRLKFIEGAEDRFIPFNMGPVGLYVNKVRLGGGRDAPARRELAGVYREELKAESTWQGIGEFPLYMLMEPGAEPPMPDADFLEEVYNVGAEFDATVMVHPPYDRQFAFHPWDGKREEHPVYQALDSAFSEHPDTEFLIHGIERPNLGFVNPLLEKHENWKYDISGIVNRTQDPKFFTEFGLSREKQQAAREAFVGEMTDDRLQGQIERVHGTWEPIFAAHPERVMWGFDAMFQWHYHEAVLDMLLKFFRGLFGRLPEANARRIAFENAAEAWR